MRDKETDTFANLAAPRVPKSPLPFFKYVGVIRDNLIAGFHEDVYRERIVERQFLWFHSFVINDPNGVKRILVDNVSNYVKADVVLPIVRPVLGNGLVTSEGETWRTHRKIMAPCFGPRVIPKYAATMIEAAKNQRSKWDALPDSSVVEIRAAMMELTLEIISRTMFSCDSDALAELISKSSAEYQPQMVFSPLSVVPFVNRLWAWYRQTKGQTALKKLDAAIYRLIAERSHMSRNPDHPDLLDRLIDARDDDTGMGMTATEVRDQVVTIFVAGHETTALALTWTWYLLSQHPTVDAKLQQELQAVLHNRAPRYDDIPHLVYTRMVFEESLRLYPPIHTLGWRQAVNDDEVCGRRIPKGSIVTVVPWVLHRHHDLWEHPERFDPERFSPERVAGRSRFAYIPFNVGPRVCIGASFAMTEAILVLATIAQRYRMHLLEGHPVDAQGMITLHPRYGLKMRLERRKLGASFGPAGQSDREGCSSMAADQ